MGDSRRLAWLALAAALAVALVFCLVAWRAEHALAGAWGFPLDDTWIHCQIARNVAQGHGWSYNPGEPVQNSSGPLWTALVALGFALFGPSPWVPKVLGAACFAGCVFYTWRLARTLSGGPSAPDTSHSNASMGDVSPGGAFMANAAAAAAALLAALSAPLAWHGLSGMETPLAALLVAATFDAFYAWRSGWRCYAWPVFAALAVAARPETLLLLPLLAAERWWSERPSSGSAGARTTRELLIALGIAALCLTPYFILNLRLSHSFFPTTFAAKAGGTGLVNALRHGDWREFLVSCTLYPYTWIVHALAFWWRKNVALLFLAPIGAYAIWRGPRRALVPGLFLVALPALRGMAAPHQTPPIQQGRYIGCLLPVLFACGGTGIVTLLRAGLATPTLDWRRLRLPALVVLALGLLASIRLELRIPQLPGDIWNVMLGLVPGRPPSVGLAAILLNERLGLAFMILAPALVLALGRLRPGALRVLGIAFGTVALLLQLGGAWRLPAIYARNVRNIDQMDVHLGHWVHDNLPAGARVAVNDIGAIAYFGERPIVDAIGLATPEITPYLTPRRLRSLIAMKRLRPPVCILFPTWFPEWVSRPSLLTPVWRQHVDDNTVLGSSVAIVYRADWDRFDRYYPDALLERLDPPDADATFAAHWRRGMRNLGLSTRAQLYVEAGDELRQLGDGAGAERAYRRAVTLDPQEQDGWDGLLKGYLARRDAARYGAALQELVHAQPESPAALEAIADYQASAGRTQEAVHSYDSALALAPDNVRVLAKLASYWSQTDAARAAAYRARLQELQSASASTPTESPAPAR